MSLQSGYKQLEYIQSSGTQYIDTGFKPNQNTKFEVDLAITNTGCHVFGARTAYLNKAFVLFWASNSNYCIQMAGSDFNGGTFDTTKRYKVTMTSSQLFLDDNLQVSYSVGDFQCEQNAWLMSCYSSSASEYARGKLYSAKIYDGNTLVRNFIPCKNPDGVIGMWDDVNSVFYGNAGTGNFTAGAEVKGSHKTLIDGTAYEVKGGKCLVNGTSYDIKKGRTLIGGAGYNITFALSYDSVFANNTWKQIIEACHNNAVPDTWNVADQKPMTINGVDYQIDIIGKNHDTYAAGGKAPLTFQMHDCYADTKVMNSFNTNSGGWTSCAMRQTHLPAILALMPTEVQNGIREVNKLTSAGSQSSTINTTADKLFLLSEIEIFGSVKYSKSGEGTQYDYYKAGNSKVKNRNGSAAYWWERSPYASNSTRFCMVYRNGNTSADDAGNAYGVAFGFCF